MYRNLIIWFYYNHMLYFQFPPIMSFSLIKFPLIRKVRQVPNKWYLNLSNEMINSFPMLKRSLILLFHQLRRLPYLFIFFYILTIFQFQCGRRWTRKVLVLQLRSKQWENLFLCYFLTLSHLLWRMPVYFPYSPSVLWDIFFWIYF